MSTLISVDTAAVLTGMTKRTLWRWLGDGTVRHQGTDARGRTLLDIDDIRHRLCISLDQAADLQLVAAADQGDGEAQNELGILCLEQQHPSLALHWFQLAAEQEHADAMHFLSTLYLHGTNDPLGEGGMEIRKNASQALMWLSKATFHGHPIAKQQLAAWTEQ